MPWSDERVNDLFVSRTYAPLSLDGLLPSRDVAFKSPPLAAPLIGLPGLAGTGAESYRWTFALLMLACLFAVALLVRALARRSGGDERLALAGVAVAPLLMGAMMRTHFDLVPVALVLATLLLVARGAPVLGLVLLGVATMTKGFPIVVAPVVLAWLVARGERHDALRGACACAAVIALLAGASVALSPSGSLDALRYQTERPVQIESLPSYGVRAIEQLGGERAVKVSSYKSDGLEHPAGNALAVFSTLFGLAFIALFTVGAAKRAEDPRTLVLASLGAIAAFAAFGKVLSPQYMIWVMPLGALALAYRLWLLAAATALGALLTFAEFPSRYFDLVDGDPLPLAIVGARDAVLVAVVALAARYVLSPAGSRRTAPIPG